MGLTKKLEELNSLDLYPMHMPGHKRCAQLYPEVEKCDITEISGYDNLHDPRGVILEEMEKAAKLYGGKECRYLVGGSTCGNLAAIYASVGEGEEVLIQRGSHKSVYNGLILRKATPVFLTQKADEDFILSPVSPEDISKKLDEHTDIKTVIITSPTYEGRVADIKAISKICHDKGVILIVDSAHGAHLGFDDRFPKSAVTEGADIVVMSLHKTLGSMTQTALLHICSDRVNTAKLDAALDIFETSSPSYVMMDSMARAIESVRKDGKSLFEKYIEKLDDLRKYAAKLEHAQIIETDDPGKILLAHRGRKLFGAEIASLARDCGIELEMFSFRYALAMTSVYDSAEGFERLKRLLDAIDSVEIDEGIVEAPDLPKPRVVMPMSKALSMDSIEAINFDAMAKTSAAFVCVYPPGIPIIAPGEEITSKAMSFLDRAINAGLTVTGLTDTGFKVV